MPILESTAGLLLIVMLMVILQSKKKMIKTPCIGTCSTGLGDEICRGCGRTYIEVIEWNSYPDWKKASILRRLENEQERVRQENGGDAKVNE